MLPELLLNFEYIHNTPDNLKNTAELQVWQERQEQETPKRRQLKTQQVYVTTEICRRR